MTATGGGPCCNLLLSTSPLWPWRWNFSQGIQRGDTSGIPTHAYIETALCWLPPKIPTAAICTALYASLESTPAPIPAPRPGATLFDHEAARRSMATRATAWCSCPADAGASYISSLPQPPPSFIPATTSAALIPDGRSMPRPTAEPLGPRRLHRGGVVHPESARLTDHVGCCFADGGALFPNNCVALHHPSCLDFFPCCERRCQRRQ